MIPIVLTALLGAADAQAQAQAVEKALVAAEPGLHRCWEKAAADDYRVEGQIAVSVTIGPLGKAARVTIKADSVGKAELEACVARAFDGVDFGGAFAPGDSVEVPVTFKAETNLTLKAADAKAQKLVGSQGVAKVLIDDKTAKAEQASLVWVDLQPGARFVRPTPKGAAFIFVRRGNASFGGATATEDDVVVLPDGCSPQVLAGNRTELVILFVPPGAEQAYRDGTRMPEPAAGGPAPTVVKLNAAEKHDLLGDKGWVAMYVQGGAAAVDKIRIAPNAAIPEHKHEGSAELLYITAGSGTLTIDGDRYPIEPFTAVYVPPGLSHSFAVGGKQLDAIQFFTPAGPEQRFKATK